MRLRAGCHGRWTDAFPLSCRYRTWLSCCLRVRISHASHTVHDRALLHSCGRHRARCPLSLETIETAWSTLYSSCARGGAVMGAERRLGGMRGSRLRFHRIDKDSWRDTPCGTCSWGQVLSQSMLMWAVLSLPTPLVLDGVGCRERYLHLKITLSPINSAPMTFIDRPNGLPHSPNTRTKYLGPHGVLRCE